MTVQLRPYQLRAIEHCRQEFRLGRQAIMCVAPCAAGKTTIFSAMAVEHVRKGGTVAAYVHRIELLDQAAQRFRSFGLEVGPTKPVVVTTVQTVTSRREMPSASLAIFDEAHILGADEWAQIPAAYRAQGTRIVGFSATPERGDNVGLGNVFDSMVVVAQIPELISLGYLVDCDVIAPKADVRKLAQDPWLAYETYGAGRSAVLFGTTVAACEKYAEEFREHGVSAEVVEANTPKDKRRDILARFASGQTQVVCNVAILTEGWNVERAKVCILARRYGSPAQYLQATGRVLRPWQNTPATLIDLSGNVDAHGYPDEEREWSLDGEACRRKALRDGIRFCRTCKCEIPADADRCPECERPTSVVAIPEAEHVELERRERLAQRDAWAGRLKPDKRRDWLAKQYLVVIGKGHKRASADYKYKAVFRQWPDQALKEAAWKQANDQASRPLTPQAD